MYHFFVERNQIGQDRDGGTRITVTGPDVNHIRNVLRMRPGERVLISDKADWTYLCRLEELSPEQAVFLVLEEKEEKTELPARLYLYQGLPKGDKLELIIQKAVELGVFRVIPVSTRRTVVKLDRKKEEARLRRWNAISESAAKQSKRLIIPEVSRVIPFEEAVREAQSLDMTLIPYECEEGMGRTRRLLEEVRPGMDVAVFIGPEGGFEEAEIAFAREHGGEPVTLGRRILRTETAGLCILSALMLKLEP